MGLPVWRAPSPEAKEAIKHDVTAPARSPIRRRSPFAGRRARPTRSQRSPRLLESDFVVSVSRSADVEPAARPSHSYLRPPPPPVPESRNYSRHGEPGPTDMPRGYYTSLFPPAGRSFGELTRSPRPLPALTPNFAPAAASRTAQEQEEPPFEPARYRSPGRRSAATLSSPRRRSTERSRSPRPDSAPSSRREGLVLISDGDEDSSGDNAVGFPPLRRMGRRTIADGPLPSSSLRESWSPATTLDGLGDRDRSFSPVNDEHWDTMLSTVVQDPLPPTADSSFTSAAASASFSNSHPSSRAGSANSNSASSSRTHLTVPSRRASGTELFMRACDTSDDDTASDTEAEDDVEASQLRRRNRAAQGDAPPSRNPNRYSRGVRDRTRDASEYVRSFYRHRASDMSNYRPSYIDHEAEDYVARIRRGETSLPPRHRNFSGFARFTGRTNEPLQEMRNEMRDELESLDQELRDARSLLERLTQRADVTDDFWASVGLTRSFADRLDSIQQRERS
ncbi:hypothetical protein BDV96DRAFT_570921 [Lophiotrema nucula]|uniref:Uncharacterized protein n=1 Tax=Lophiotrema nucula TaxID=690887 RepID=A0A6A5ZF96_9PLEO|nr:hypothetical protein BDV96DRAFT_570921 [Lophiotrema nucula]